MANEEAKRVKPSDFWITIGGRKRQVKFGNRALLEVEEKYGGFTQKALEQFATDLQTKPFEMIPWVLPICLKDKEGLETKDEILDAMDDDENPVSFVEVLNVIAEAMSDSISNIMADGKKKRTAAMK